MFINGKWLQGKLQFEVSNPATSEVIGHVADGGAAQAVEAIEAAQAAFSSWSSQTSYVRATVLFKAHQLMLQRQQQLAELMTREQGKPFKAAMNEVRYAADFLSWFAEESKRVYGEVIPSARADQRFITRYQPVGVVAAITPWNYPISMITRKLAPALAAGCTAVLKPAEATPLCAIAVFEILQEAGVPDGVINLVTTSKPAPVGGVFCSHPLVKKLTFTGSTEVGQQLAQACAPQLKRVSMELGGHAPFIAFADVDPEHAAKGASLVKFLNAGQACISPNRLFVHHSILDQFVVAFNNRIKRLHVGNGMGAEVSVGPLVNSAAIDKVDAQVQDAISKGAKLHAGGERLQTGALSDGHFYAPTLLSKVTSEMKIYREETFGPVAPVIGFDTYDEVINMANDTHYGLAAYVYTNSLKLGMRAFEDLNFGIIGVNDINPTSAAAPFGGMNQSGLGREGAREGLAEYLETKLGGFSI